MNMKPDMKPVLAPKAPAALGPYSAGMAFGNLLFLSGQTPVDPATGLLVPGDIREQTAQCARNLGAVLEAAGSGFDRVLKTTCFLADMADFAAFNQVYAEYFISKPARSTVAVKALPKGALVEIELIAYQD